MDHMMSATSSTLFRYLPRTALFWVSGLASCCSRSLLVLSLFEISFSICNFLQQFRSSFSRRYLGQTLMVSSYSLGCTEMILQPFCCLSQTSLSEMQRFSDFRELVPTLESWELSFVKCLVLLRWEASGSSREEGLDTLSREDGLTELQLQLFWRVRQMKGTCMPRVEPTLVDALGEMGVTRWDWRSADGRPRGSGSFRPGGVPQQNYKVHQYYISIELTMHLPQQPPPLHQQDLMPLVKQYLGSVLFKNAYQYESIANGHAKFLEFNLQRLPLAEQPSQEYRDIGIEDLFIGSNSGQYLHVQILRMLQFNHALVCLVLDQLRPKSTLRNAILVIVFGSREAARRWSQENSFLSSLRIRNPFKGLHKFYTTLQFILVRPENIDVKRSYNISNRQPQSIKKEANQKFREKNYEEALLMYEMGLGLLFDCEKKRERAVLYANSSQCLYEMRLFAAALRYAEISITLDRSYIKGLYRKLNCLLQLDTKEIPRVISAISLMGSVGEVEEAQLKYTKFMANQCGIYDWMDIFQNPAPVFGEYVSSKVQLKRFSKNELFFRAEQKISQFKLVLVHKPLIYKKSEQERFGEEYTALTKQIQTYARYEQRFYEKFQSLPYQYLLHGQPLTFQRSKSNESMQINQIHTICLRCLELQKTIENVSASKTEVLGIWEKLYAFKHECLANCTYIHVKGALVVFALRDIRRDEILSIDFLNWQTINRRNFMKEKLGRSCECSFCSFQWEYYEQTATPQVLYQFLMAERGILNDRHYDKINLYFMWELMYDKRYRQSELMRQYLTVLERYPLWECVMNLLRYLRSRTKNDLFDLIKTTLKRILEKYFRITHAQAVALLKSIL